MNAAPHLAVVPAPVAVNRGPIARSDDWRCDLPAERAVLGAVLRDAFADAPVGAWGTASAILSAGDFYDPRHRLLWEVFAALVDRGDPVEFHGLGAELRARNAVNTVSLQYVADLSDETVTTAWVDVHARLVAERASRRQAVARAEAFAAELKGGAALAPAIADVLGKLESVPLPGTVTPTLAGDVDRYVATIEGTAPSPYLTPTGLASLDQALGGGLAADVIALMGLPGAGKTTLTIQWALHVAETSPVYYWSGEQNRGEVTVIAVAMLARIPFPVARDPRRNRPTPDQHVRQYGALNALDSLPFHVTDENTAGRPMTVAGIVADVRRLNAAAKAKGGKRVGLIVVDNLLELEPREKHRNTWDAVGANIDDLRRARKLLGIPIVVICHPNGDATSGKVFRRLRTADIAGGKAAGRKFGAILCLHREDVHPTRDHAKDPPAPGMMQIYSDKVRGVGRVYAEVMELKSEHRFISVGHRIEEADDARISTVHERPAVVDALDAYGAGDGLPDVAVPAAQRSFDDVGPQDAAQGVA